MKRQTFNKSLALMPVLSIDPVVTVVKGECYINNYSFIWMKNVWMQVQWMNDEWMMNEQTQ
jgi:hypothetical protein